MSTLVTIANVLDRPQALILRSVLEAAGIPVLLPDLNTFAAAPHLAFTIGGGYRVQVAAADEAAARAILKEIEAA